MITSFDNKTVIITGASAGVGAACARLFASHKAKLVLVARGEAALNVIADELRSQCEVLTVVMNVASNEDCLALLEKAEAAFGAVHVIVNNAGMHARGDLEKVAPLDVAAMVDINLRAPLQGAATYAATKAGLRAFSYALSDELLGSGISVGVVSPGPIDTGFIMDEIDAVEDIVFSQPMSSAEQVAEGILAIASGQQVEVVLRASSAKLTHLSYLFPNLRRRLRPKLYEQGRKNKDKYRNRQAAK